MALNPDHLDPFQCRQAVEALRNGVPNRAAVEILGCNRPSVESKFDELLLQSIGTEALPEGALGMLVSGDFGSGKSHLLSYLEHRALAEGFVCSRVAISKETPLYDLGKVFASAMQHAQLPGRTGQLMEEIGDKINARTPEYDRFSRWLNVGENGLHAYFPATMMIYERSGDRDLQSEIESFWAGERIAAARVRNGLKLISQHGSFNFQAPTARDLPPQRLRFATELIKGVGYKGWVVLLDELELVGSYSLLQRARSYAELGRWLGKTADDAQYPGLIAVGTFTLGFAASVLGPFGKDDKTVAPNRLRERNAMAEADWAEAAINALEGDGILLDPPGEVELQNTLEKLRLLYQQAYGWDTPALTAELDGAAYQNTMRYKVRACINEWDLRRIYPDAQPETEGREFEHRYQEMPEMEQETKDD